MDRNLIQHTIDSLPVFIAYIGADKKYKFVNNAYLNWLGLAKEDIVEKNIDDVLGTERYSVIESHVDMALLGQKVSYEVIMPSHLGKSVFFARYFPYRNSKDDIDGFSVLVEDITHQRLMENEKDNLVVELQEALKEIKVLKGIIPICSYCHNIRDDEGAWEMIEIYISKHSDAAFSHGICPDCLPKVMKDIKAENKNDKNEK
ncbi:MAG: PAS domain-containing protein [Gammaproteobacteria bacterium]|nr:PAS domain-containing protein [Gammaproteobacteria bacterium]